ncbi:NAD(P)-dependent nickel-iron dehydrogenase flavin-containing subunit [Mariprofundus ferrinatatus]|uniref:NAD(P)-dependent nickel-iron dehydrogenase flavin-containing subunit n=1 Tax=Mariprofundus ferrinatatus TaxID=1921087 RepID=A0A2K8LE31_9PROT|nr:NADH-ubiquinone oxidoreductase-F iron-sulfur binding region domain-containing protein [Mariprofundus ferrinatatus]ATX82536.1 NAD(P)-dependent nickel-iron dehydrogenase flavin-containing subunit [Mariprofundus ferrinatatus]
MTMNTQPPEHLLHVMHAHQEEHRFISDQAVNSIAEKLKLPRAQVEAVREFYAFFHSKPRGTYDLLFSNCTSCGSPSLMRQLCELLHVTADKTRSDGAVSIGETSCIGMCDHGASLLVNGRPLHSLDGSRIEAIAKLIEAATPVEQWPAEWFEINNHIHRSDLLLKESFTPGAALHAVEAGGADAALEKIRFSDLRGRGGAGFSTAQKWQFCREAAGDTRYVICNADEGEPGTFKDRVLLTSYADAVFEGMALCGRIIGARQGYIYLRAEYRYLLDRLENRLAERREAGLLGEKILGIEGFDFDIEIVVGAGAYICGEESALIESLEEKPGNPRIRPPFPVTHGYMGKPTVVNNVETLAAAAAIVLHGERWFRGAGTWQSRGTKILSVSGDCARPGIYEYPFGVSINDILKDCGAVQVQAVQVGGPSGRLVDPSHFDHHIAFEDLATGGSLMIFHHSRNLLEVIRNFTCFFTHESCGFCTPCRVGTALLKNGMDKVASGHGTAHDLDELKATAALVSRRSHCGLGMTAPNPIRDGLKYFPELFEARLLHQEMEPEFNLDASLEEARQLTHRDDAEAHL